MGFIGHFVDDASPRPRTHRMTIIAQDPSVRDASGNILRGSVRVPADRLEPGPRGHRFHLVDYEPRKGMFPSADLAGWGDGTALDAGWAYVDAFADASDEVLLESREFHAQNLYAIAARTLAAFESALGRRVPWSFGSHELFLVPHGLVEPNAYYADDDQGLFFGTFSDRDGRFVHTCLSHDIVAHETTHAVLDGLRPQFEEPGLPDQAAFHEAFADIVALLSVFSTEEFVEHLLGEPDERGRIAPEALTEEALKDSALFTLAEQVGDEVHLTRGGGLRRSVRLEPMTGWLEDPAYDEPHRRGEILVAAVTQTLLRMWSDRLRPLIHPEGLDRSRAAEEGAKSASHLLQMAIRSIDYCPPLEFEFADFLDAILVSDAELAPDDDHGYREALTAGFNAFDIRQPPGQIIDLSREARRPRHSSFHYQSLRSDVDEVYRFIWENRQLLRLDSRFHTRVESVRPCVRVGPDGFVVAETVADYVQMASGTAREIEDMGVTLPPDIDPNVEVQLLGGGAIIFDEFGGAKYHQTKPIDDWARQTARLTYLARRGLVDTRGRYGFSLGIPRAQRFAQLHRPGAPEGEAW